jgi:regulator of sigma E protease
MLIFIIVLIGLSLLILVHEAGHFFAAKWFGLKVDEFGFGFPPRMFAWKKGETEYSINWLPFGGFVKIAGETDRLQDMKKLEKLSPEEKKRMFVFEKAWKRSLIILAGVAVNFVVGWFLLSFLFMVGSPQILLVSGIESNSPAANAGLKAGDVILNYTGSQDFINFVNQHRGREITLDVRRGTEKLEVKAIPRTEVQPNEGALGVFLTEAGIPRYGFFKAIWEGLKFSFALSGQVLVALGELLKNLFVHAKLLEGVVGPLGIFGVAEEAGRIGFAYLVQLLALISINLAVMNLVPFPALDGGRFFLILVEKVKGSPISPRLEGIVNIAGFVLLVLLMVLLTFRDISHFF